MSLPLPTSNIAFPNNSLFKKFCFSCIELRISEQIDLYSACRENSCSSGEQKQVWIDWLLPHASTPLPTHPHALYVSPYILLSTATHPYTTFHILTFPNFPLHPSNFLMLPRFNTVQRAFTLPHFFSLLLVCPNKNLWTHVKSKNNWGNCRVLFLVFLIENELFTENGKKGSPR